MWVLQHHAMYCSRCSYESSLKGVAAFSADDFPGEGVAALVFFGSLDDAFFPCPLSDQRLRSVEVLPADNCLMMIVEHVLVFLAIVDVTVKSRVGKGLLENAVADVFLVAEIIRYAG